DAGAIYVAGQAGVLVSSYDFAMVKYADWLHYTPPPEFIGTDSFSFTAIDPNGNTATSSVTVVVWLPTLQFNTTVTNLLMTAQGMRLQIDGASGTNPVILYASTNLVDWQSIDTNFAVLGSAIFVDPNAMNRPWRFYRASQQ